MKFTEAQLEIAIIELLENQGYPHYVGASLNRADQSQVLLVDDMYAYLEKRYQNNELTDSEINAIIHQLQTLPASDLYASNKTFCNWLSDGFLFKREPIKGQEQ